MDHLNDEYNTAQENPVYLASFSNRFAAALIDSLITLIPTILIRYAMVGSILHDSWQSLVCNIILGWLYAALLESSAWQATLGKRAMGIYVTGLDGARISFLKATGRHFSKMLSTIILCIGYLMMLWSDKKQTLHDVLAATIVVYS